MSRTFEVRPATRESVNLFIGLVGASSSGKTMSALRLASGIQTVTGGEIFLCDTENRRATFYSDMFKFQHVQFDPPHGAIDYIEAIKTCEARGAKIIIIDSASHEHEGTGGLLEAHEAEVQRLTRGDESKRERMKMLAWNAPKTNRRKLLRKIIESKANIIMCFRAKHISKPVKINGETKVVDQGFVPIAGEEFVYEMQLSAMLPPNSQGVPNWHPEAPGERMAVKLPVQFRPFVKDGEQLSEDLGERLARWAVGGAAPAAPSTGSAPSPRERLMASLHEAATEGTEPLREAWSRLTATERKLVGEPAITDLKALAAKQAA